MSDGQTFYLILAVFYVFDCLKFTPPHTIVFCSRLNWFQRGHRKSGKSGKLEKPGKPWSPREPLMRFAGVGKIAFLAPLLPWPRVILTPSQKEVTGHTRHPRNIRRLTRILLKGTNDLRALGLLIFLYFFIVIPIVYFQHRGQIIVLATIGYGYIMLWMTAVIYYSVHKRFLPDDTSDRFKGLIYTAFLPWHSMRCADEILVRSSLPWCKLAFITLHNGHPQNHAAIQKLWREAHFHPSPEYPTDTLAKLFEEEKIDTSTWLNAPTLTDESSHYCPCCHLGYSPPATTCSDCNDITLAEIEPSEGVAH